MKYMLLVHSNPTFPQRWEQLTDEERARFGRGHLDLTEALTASGELVVSEALADPATARRVDTSATPGVVSDGPFAESKEHLAGFYLVDCAGEDRALEIAAQIPDAVWGLVEIRPVLDLSPHDIDG